MAAVGGAAFLMCAINPSGPRADAAADKSDVV